jgi:hypothetical protein
MSGVLIVVVTLAVVVTLFVVALALGLARAARRSDQVERGALREWVRRKRKIDRAA